MGLVDNVLDCLLMQQDLNDVCKWADTWQLRLNPDQTKWLTIGKIKFDSDYVLNDVNIELVVVRIYV